MIRHVNFKGAKQILRGPNTELWKVQHSKFEGPSVHLRSWGSWDKRPGINVKFMLEGPTDQRDKAPDPRGSSKMLC